MTFILPPRIKTKTTGFIVPPRIKPVLSTPTKSVLEFAEAEKKKELNKYMGKVVRGLKAKALIKETSTVPTEPIVIPPRDDQPKGFISGFKEGFKLPFKKFFPTIRAGAQLASTPVAYGIDKIQGGDITYSQLSEKNFEMAKEMIRGDTKWGDNMSKGAQLYLESQGVGKYGENEIGLKDISVLASMGFFNIFGDPFLEATAFARLIKGVKEVALWKKVGQIKKQLPIGTIIKKPNIVEIPIAKDLKIKIKPFRSEIKIEGFAKRSWKPEILPPQKLIGTTDDAVKDLVKIIEQQSGAKVTGVIKGKDLILQPTLKSQLLATEAGFVKIPDKPKLKIKPIKLPEPITKAEGLKAIPDELAKIPKGLKPLVEEEILINRVSPTSKKYLGYYSGEINIQKGIEKIPKVRQELYKYRPTTEKSIILHELGHKIENELPDNIIAKFNTIKGKEFHPKRYNVIGEKGGLTWTEDLAESFAKWSEHYDIFSKEFPQRAKFFDELGLKASIAKNSVKLEYIKKATKAVKEVKPIETLPAVVRGKDFVLGEVIKPKLTARQRMRFEQMKEQKIQREKKVREEVKISEVPKKALSGFDNFIDLNKIKTKNIPYKEMDIAELVRGDKIFPAIRRSGFYATKEIQTATIRNIYEQKLSPHLMALKQDEYKLGEKFGIIFSKLWKPTEKAIRIEKEFNIKNVKIIKDLGNKYKIEATKQNLEHLSDVIEKKVKATPNEEAYVKELREVLDNLRDQANLVREIMGKDKMGYIQNYIPHIQKTTLWNELLSNVATISDNLDFIIPNQVKNPFAFKRLSEEMPNAERNLYILLDRYVGAIGKDIYLTPAIENIKAYNGVIKNREKIQAGKYWDEYIRTGLIGKQHKLDTALSIGQEGRKVLVKWNNMVNLAFLTGKVAWNIATQPLSYIMNVPMEAGVKNSITAIYKSFNSGLRQYVKKNSNVLNIKSNDVRAVAVGEGRNIQNRIYRTKINKYNDFISMLGSVEERELTLASYIAGLDRAKNLGYTGDDALWFADLTAARTQSMYNKENRALILNSDIARTMFPFQSFSVEMFNHLKEISTKAGGAMQLTYRQRFGKLFGLLVGLFLANWYSEELTGRKKTTIGTFFPFIGSYIDILVAKALGKGYYGGRSPITVMQIGEDIIKGSRDYLKHGNFKRLRKVGVNFGLALGGIGGGGQINNLIDGIMADINEDVKNIEGDVMFNVKDATSKVKASIFGVWATKEGIEYWLPKEKKEPSTLTPKLKIKPIKIKPLKLKIKPIKLK